jgi:hypothetical protein
MQTIQIGTKYYERKSNGKKNEKISTVIDILSTYNSKGELIRTRYIASRDYLGQDLINYDVVGTTILMSLIRFPVDQDKEIN